jgi:hypothetical protein
LRTPAIIRSGWWVALAAVALSAGMLWLLIAPGASTEAPRAAVIEPGTALVSTELIVRAMPRDGLTISDDPSRLTAAEVVHRNEHERGKLLVSDDRVIGVAHAGEARAYPLRLMRWHEVVNDVVGGRSVAVTYGPLCDSVAVFSRDTPSGKATLGLSGLLYNSNALLYDRERADPADSPLWTQLGGQPVAGRDPAQAPALRPLPAVVTTWSRWLERHPQTTVMAPVPEIKKLYKRDPYHSYFGSDSLRFPVEPLPPAGGWRNKDRIVIATIDGVHYEIAIPDLVRTLGSPSGTAQVSAGGLALELHFDEDLGFAELIAADPERLSAIRSAFWFSWYSLKGTIPDIIRTAG